MDMNFDTRALLAAVESLPREYPFLLDTFVKDNGCVEDDKALYDYRKKGKIMAPFIVDGAGGVPMSRDGFSVREIGFPTIAPERVININDIATRSFGEKILGGSTPAQRAKAQQAADLKEMLAARSFCMASWRSSGIPTTAATRRPALWPTSASPTTSPPPPPGTRAAR